MVEKIDGQEIYDPKNPKHQHKSVTRKILERDNTGKAIREVFIVGGWTYSVIRKAKLLQTTPEKLVKNKRALETPYKELKHEDNNKLLQELRQELK